MAIVISRTTSLVNPYPLITPFSHQGIAFNVDFGGVTHTAATVTATIAGVAYTFIPVKTSTVGNVDYYTFDFSDILKYVIDLPPITETVAGTSIAFTYSIVVAGATSSTETVTLCYGIQKIGGDYGIMTNTYAAGLFDPIYHNGKISFYNYDAAGDYEFTIGGVAYTYTLVVGYNIITLDATQLLSGTITKTHTSIVLVYKAVTGTAVAWLNKCGAWSFWNFRKLNESLDTKSTNEIPIFSLGNTSALSRFISKESNLSISFDTIAVDMTHYRLLTEIANSPCIIYDTRLHNLESCSKVVAETKQNLNFQITLKAQQNAVSY